MLTVKMDETNGTALFEPHGPLSEKDFKHAAQVVNAWIEKNGQLKGLVINAKAFSGWDSFGALVSHLAFIRDHQRKIGRVAFATDTPVGTVAEKMARHFIKAEIRLFPYREFEQAQVWAAGSDTHDPH